MEKAKLKLDVRKRLRVIQPTLTHRIYHNASDTIDELVELVVEYLSKGKDIIDKFELTSGIDELTFRPYILVIMSIKK